MLCGAKMAFQASLLVLTLFGFCLPHSHGSGLCLPTNVSLQEGSSKILAPDIAIHSNMLSLRKMNESTSDWDIILHINERRMNFLDTEYEGYFIISSNSLAVTSASRLLSGRYQVVYSLNSSCVHEIFLKILGSKGTQDRPLVIQVVIGIVVPAVFVVCIVVPICLWRRNGRGGNGKEQFESCEVGKWIS